LIRPPIRRVLPSPMTSSPPSTSPAASSTANGIILHYCSKGHGIGRALTEPIAVIIAVRPLRAGFCAARGTIDDDRNQRNGPRDPDR
jgi:hypothetical protein